MAHKPVPLFPPGPMQCSRICIYLLQRGFALINPPGDDVHNVMLTYTGALNQDSWSANRDLNPSSRLGIQSIIISTSIYMMPCPAGS